MRSDLKIKPITEIVNFNPKYSIKKGTKVPYVEMAAVPEHNREIAYFDIREFKSGSKFTNGDTLFSRITPCLQNGKTARVSGLDDKQIANGSTEFIVMSAVHEDDKDFVYYLSLDNSFRKYAESRMEGTTGRQRVSWQALSEYKLPTPPKNERIKIAHILSTLDDKIKLNRKMNETLEAMAQTIFKSWFVDFDPVHVKAKCSNDEELDTAIKELGISKDIFDLFPSEFEDSELGMIPKGWEVIKFNDIASVRKGLSYKGKHKSENKDDVPMFNLGNFDRSGQYRPEKLVYYNGDYRERHLIRGGQLMIANTDMTQERIILGLPLFVPELSKEDMIFTHHVFAIDFINLELENKLKYYLFYTFLNPKFREIAEGYATGTTVLALPKDGVMKFNLLLASNEIIESFNKVVSVLVNKMNTNKYEIDTLQKTRDTLLPKLLSGELDVSELDLDTGFSEDNDPKHIFDIYKDKFGEPFDIFGLYWDDMDKQIDLAMQCIEKGKVISDILSKEELELIEEAKQGNIVF